MLKTMAIRATIAAILGGLCMSAHAIADTQRIDIPAGSLLTALETLAKQANVDLVYQDAQVRGLRTRGVAGDLSPHDAVMKLLEGTPLQVRRDEASGAILITIPAPGAPAASLSPREGGTSGDGSTVGEERKSFWSRLRLAQSDTPSLSQGGDRSEDPGNTASNQQAAGPSRSQESIALEEIVVTGSRLRAGLSPQPQPVRTFDKEDLRRSGQTSVADFLNTLPEVSTANVEASGGSAGTTTVSLRGLKAGSTLVLLNGRRIDSAGVTATYFDLNSIPAAAIERIDVLPYGSSAIYGGDALAGVVNVVLSSRYTGGQLYALHGRADDLDQTTASLAHGWTGQKLSLSAVAYYDTRGSLLGTERDLTASDDYRRFGATDLRSINSNPATISAVSGTLPGLSCSVAGVPRGSPGVGLTPADFASGCNNPNLSSRNAAFAQIPESERYGAILNGDYQITPSVDLFTELLYSRVESSLERAPLLFTGTIPATNPFNPFGQAVRANYAFTHIPNETVTDTRYKRGLLGLRGYFGDQWRWELAGWATDMEALQTQPALVTSAVNTAVASTDPTRALNVFRDGVGAPDEVVRTFTSESTTPFGSDLSAVNGFVSGTLFSRSARPIDIVTGLEYTDENYFRGTATVLDAGREYYAAFVEARTRLLGSGSGHLGTLTASVAARYDDYSDFGNSTNPQFGLIWSLNNRLTLRASYGTAFKPPSLSNLYTPNNTGTTTVSDPRRGGQSTVVENFTGGNPDLDPEEAEATSVGIVYAGPGPSRMTVAVTHWQNDLEALILTPVPSLLVANESTFPERIIRAAPNAQDIAAGRPGQIVRVSSTLTNFGKFDLAGVDAQLSFAMESRFGRVTPRAAVTYTYKYDGSLTFAAPQTDRVSRLDTTGYSPRWKAQLSALWQRGPVEASLTGRYVGSYLAADRIRQLGDFLFVDASVAFDPGDMSSSWRALQGLRLEAGVVNLFDENLEFSGSAADPYDRTQSDLRGRWLHVRLARRW